MLPDGQLVFSESDFELADDVLEILGAVFLPSSLVSLLVNQFAQLVDLLPFAVCFVHPAQSLSLLLLELLLVRLGLGSIVSSSVLFRRELLVRQLCFGFWLSACQHRLDLGAESFQEK